MRAPPLRMVPAFEGASAASIATGFASDSAAAMFLPKGPDVLRVCALTGFSVRSHSSLLPRCSHPLLPKCPASPSIPILGMDGECFSSPETRRRLLWMVKIKRDKWQPTNATCMSSVSTAICFHLLACRRFYQRSQLRPNPLFRKNVRSLPTN